VSNYKEKIKDLENEIKYLKEEADEKDTKINNLENGFLKLYRLTSSHTEKAPDDKALIETINKIADFFYFSIEDFCNKSPEIEWIDWNSI
jgi:cell division protein FtsB